MESKNDIKIQCSDGFELAATLYQPKKVKGAVMIAPATGIRRRFYLSFASYLAENGYGVICYENRGIGDSNNGASINRIDASLVNWGRLDMTAVLNTLKHIFPKTSYHLVGHSAGGQLVGLMDNATDINSMFNFACSSGSLGNLTYPFKLQAHFFMNIFIPASNLFFGQTNSQWLGMGEPLPKLVGHQWSTWCRNSGYVATDFGRDIDHHWYDELAFPSMWLHATDDQIANLKNVQDMIRVFSKLPNEVVTLDPDQEGFQDIGHMKFFSSKRSKLWSRAVSWLDRHAIAHR